MNATISLPMQAPPVRLWPYARRLVPLTLIILMHIGFFYALQAGLLQPPIHQLVPNEVLVRFITAEPARQPTPAPQPAPTPAPKTVPVLKKPLPKPVVKTPPLAKPAPAEQAITQPMAEPQPAQPTAASAPPAAPATAPAAAAAAASAPAAVAAAPKTISSGVEYLQAPQPEYPLLARRKGEEGKVVLRALINIKGRPEGVEIQTSSGSARLDEAARQAVLRAVFKPHLEDGHAVMVYAIVPIKFQLDR